MSTKTSSSLEDLDKRLMRIESSLDSISAQLCIVPDMISTGVDIVDEKLSKAGIGDQKLVNAAKLSNRLLDQDVVDLLEKILEQSAQAKIAVEAAAEIPNLVSTMIDIVDDKLSSGGLGDDKIRHLATMLDLLLTDETAATIEETLRLSGDAFDAVQVMAELPNLVATSADVLDNFMQKLQINNPEFSAHERVMPLMRILERGTHPDVLSTVEKAVSTAPKLELLLNTTNKTMCGKAGKTGLFGLMGALKDPDVQRAANFMIRFAKNLGQELEKKQVDVARHS